MRTYLDMFQMAEDKNSGTWFNECKDCTQTDSTQCEPVSKKHPIGKCPGVIAG